MYNSNLPLLARCVIAILVAYTRAKLLLSTQREVDTQEDPKFLLQKYSSCLSWGNYNFLTPHKQRNPPMSTHIWRAFPENFFVTKFQQNWKSDPLKRVLQGVINPFPCPNFAQIPCQVYFFSQILIPFPFVFLNSSPSYPSPILPMKKKRKFQFPFYPCQAPR